MRNRPSDTAVPARTAAPAATVDDVFDIQSLLRALTTENPTAPRLTHYDASGRIELSGRVLVNWVNKAANLLVEEFDTQPGDVLVLDLPTGHWRSAYWALAAWLCGAHVMVTDARWSGAEQRPGTPLMREPVDVVVTTSPTAWAESGADVIAVETQALARSLTGELAGAIDEAATLATYGDDAPDCEAPLPDDPALSDVGYTLSYRELPTQHEGGRVLLPLTEEAVPLQVTALVPAVLAAGGSLVCVQMTSEPAPDLERVATDEQATITHL